MVSWSLRARADLKAIHAFTSKDSAANARTVVHEIVQRANLIESAPRGGRVVPELSDMSIREVPVHSWRVIYQVRDSAIFIVTLVHKRRAPAAEDLRPT